MSMLGGLHASLEDSNGWPSHDGVNRHGHGVYGQGIQLPYLI